MIPAPRLVLFDLGNVLIRLNSIEEAFPFFDLHKGDEKERRRLEEELRLFRQSSIFDRFERGLAGPREFCEDLRKRFATDLTDEQINEYYLRILGPEVEGMKEIVEDLKKKGMRVAALTDTSPFHLAILDTYPAVQALEGVIASCVTGRKKPDPETFRDATRRLGVDPGDVFFTDDLELNVAGARKAGLRAELFVGPAALRKTLGIDSHR